MPIPTIGGLKEKKPTAAKVIGFFAIHVTATGKLGKQKIPLTPETSTFKNTSQVILNEK